MWILPKNLSLPVSSGSTDTVEMLSDLNEQSQACALSLSVRGTPSSLRTWSQKWKRDSWTQYLYGRMLRTSPANLSAISSWISSRLPTLASHSATLGSETEKMMNDTSGPTVESLFSPSGPDGSGLKTSRGTLRLDSPQSLPTWKKMVIQRRGEYSARLKSARLISGSGCLSWPTIIAGDWKGQVPGGGREPGMLSGIIEKEAKSWPTATVSDVHTGNLKSSQQKPGSMHSVTLPQAVEKMWPTSSSRDYKDTPGMSTERDGNPEGRIDQLPRKVYAEMSGPPAPVNDNTPGSRRESWRTPSTMECNGGQASPEEMTSKGKTVKLRYQVEGAKIGAQTSAKLNPRWVETLMGLPMGWTSPDAPASLIANWKRFTAGWLKAQTEQTSCECAATELCPKPQSEPSKFYIENLLDFELESLGLL